MISEKRKIGDVGEAVASRFLVEKDFKILESNYLKKWGEIDIIAKNKDILHFVEVKTLQSRVSREPQNKDFSRETVYNPAENVHPKKLERMHRAIMSYIEENKVPHETDWQIDVVTVLLDLKSNKAKVDFLENVI